MLRADRIRFSFGKTDVLHEVSLELPAGSLACVVGPNGSGKSTLLRCLYGALRPSAGEVQIEGLELGTLTRREIARRVAVVPQQCHQLFPVSVEHFVGMGRFAHEPVLGRPSPRDREVVRATLHRLGLERLARRSVAELSGGEFRRVLVAQALAQEPRVLLMDEPLQQVDLRHQLELLELARAFAHEQGGAVLVVLHDLGLAARYGDVLHLLARGRMVAAGTREEVLTEERIEQIFGVRTSIGRHVPTGAWQIFPLEPSPAGSPFPLPHLHAAL